MVKPKVTQCWYRKNKADPWMPGRFHQWGSELSPIENEGVFSVGLVEDTRTGAMLTIYPGNIHFGSAPDCQIP